MNYQKNKFKKEVGQLLGHSPQSIKELLGNNHSQPPQLHNCANPEKPVGTNKKTTQYARVHIHIRQDLFNKILDLALKRKKDRTTTTRKASQRAIIEEALEIFFNQKNIQQ